MNQHGSFFIGVASFLQSFVLVQTIIGQILQETYIANGIGFDDKNDDPIFRNHEVIISRNHIISINYPFNNSNNSCHHNHSHCDNDDDGKYITVTDEYNDKKYVADRYYLSYSPSLLEDILTSPVQLFDYAWLNLTNIEELTSVSALTRKVKPAKFLTYVGLYDENNKYCMEMIKDPKIKGNVYQSVSSLLDMSWLKYFTLSLSSTPGIHTWLMEYNIDVATNCLVLRIPKDKDMNAVESFILPHADQKLDQIEINKIATELRTWAKWDMLSVMVKNELIDQDITISNAKISISVIIPSGEQRELVGLKRGQLVRIDKINTEEMIHWFQIDMPDEIIEINQALLEERDSKESLIDDFYQKDLSLCLQYKLYQNLYQPSKVPRLTMEGFKKIKMPPKIYGLILKFYQEHRESEHREPPKFCENKRFRFENESNYRLTPYDGCVDLQHSVRPILEEWSGLQLAPTYCFGIRTYLNNSRLYMHVDRIKTHAVSAIINVDQDVDKDWPLEILDHDNNVHEVYLSPGEMILYESAKLLHGRPKPFIGRYFANIFLHYVPVDSTKWIDDEN